MNRVRNRWVPVAAALVALGLVVPAAMAERSTARDPYAGYQSRSQRYEVRDRPQRVEHRPRVIRAEPLLRPERTYRNAPAPVEDRVRAAATEQLRHHRTVTSDRVVAFDRSPVRRYEDIGRARVIRNPLHNDRETRRDRLVGSDRSDRSDHLVHDSVVRYHRPLTFEHRVGISSHGYPSSYVSIHSHRGYHPRGYYDRHHHPLIHHRPFHRSYHGSHFGWRSRHHLPRYHCVPSRFHHSRSSGISLHFRW